MPMKLRDCVNAVVAKMLEVKGSSDSTPTTRVTVLEDSATCLIPTPDGVQVLQLGTESETGQVVEVTLTREHFAELPSLQEQYLKLRAAEMEPGEMPEGLPPVIEVHGG